MSHPIEVLSRETEKCKLLFTLKGNHSLEGYLEYKILSTYLLLPPDLLTGFMITDSACSVSQFTSHENDQNSMFFNQPSDTYTNEDKVLVSTSLF